MHRIGPFFLCLGLLACASSSGEIDDGKSGTTGNTGTTAPGSDGDGGGTTGDDGGGDDGGDGATGTAVGPVYINEFMPSNASTVQDEGGAFPDWIELYNDGDEVVELAGWTITDDLDEPGKHAFDASLSIEPGGFLVLYADDDEEEGPLHVGFSLLAEGESIGLYDAGGSAVDELNFGTVGTDLSMARVPDGSSVWEVTDAHTAGASNGD
jgi:hypothetical protein